MLLLCTGCNTSITVVSTSSFNQTNQIIKEELKSKGYYQTDKTVTMEYDGTVRQTSRENTDIRADFPDYIDAVKLHEKNTTTVNTEKGRYYINKYCFSNSEGDTLEYLLKYYQSKKYDEITHHNVTVLYDISLVGCALSDKKEYDGICGDYGIVSRNAESPQVQTIKVYNPMGEYVAVLIVLGIIGIGTIWGLSLL